MYGLFRNKCYARPLHPFIVILLTRNLAAYNYNAFMVFFQVFPYLFYTDALRNLTHATGIQMFAILGKQPKNFYMWLYSLIGWDLCYFQIRWCKNYARQQPIIVDIEELERILIQISQSYMHPPSLL